MTKAEKLKSTLSAIFRRKGHDGRYTREFEHLEPFQRDALLGKVTLRDGELPVFGSVENVHTWLIVSTQRIVWRRNGTTQTLAIADVRTAKADFSKMVADGIKKDQLRELQVETMDHKDRTIEVEEGGPLIGMWNVLMNLGTRNRRASQISTKGKPLRNNTA
jgi:hypothetical protein